MLAIILALTLAAEPTGSLAGTVRHHGEVPPAQRIPTTDGGTVYHRDLIVDAKSKGLKDVVVIVEDAPKFELKKNLSPAVVDQRDMLFLPRVLAVRAGQKVRFENSDLCNHAVQAHSTTEANVFNVATPPNQPFEHAFVVQKNPVVIGCPIHAWMRAYLIVTDHPFVAITDKEGKFRIEGIPPGKYRVAFRHLDTATTERRDVEIRAGATATLEWDRRP